MLILRLMKINDERVCVPPLIINENGVFFVIDNSDFNEDNSDGKHTAHTTATAIHQQR